MMAASVYAAIASIIEAFAQDGIAKTHLNRVEQYQYRSIDDVTTRLGPLLAKHRLCVLPRVVERTVEQRQGLGDALLMHVALRVTYTLVSADDGSSHSVEAYGEALDGGDKGTAKALSSAFKSAMLQTFCVPVSNLEDTEAVTQKLTRGTHRAEPPEGWPAWAAGIIDMIGICESREALTSIQTRNRQLLLALGREQPDLYQSVGQTFAERAALLEQRRKAPAAKRRRQLPFQEKSIDVGKDAVLA